jgi:hypothetical protein
MNRLSKIAAVNVATAAALGAFSRRKAIAETCPEKSDLYIGFCLGLSASFSILDMQYSAQPWPIQCQM